MNLLNVFWKEKRKKEKRKKGKERETRMIQVIKMGLQKRRRQVFCFFLFCLFFFFFLEINLVPTDDGVRIGRDDSTDNNSKKLTNEDLFIRNALHKKKNNVIIKFLAEQSLGKKWRKSWSIEKNLQQLLNEHKKLNDGKVIAQGLKQIVNEQTWKKLKNFQKQNEWLKPIEKYYSKNMLDDICKLKKVAKTGNKREKIRRLLELNATEGLIFFYLWKYLWKYFETLLFIFLILSSDLL